MKEQLISFETAKLAKEKGFDIPQYSYYDKAGNPHWLNLEETEPILNSDGIYIIPNQHLIQKWLREKHNINVIIGYNRYGSDYSITIYTENDTIPLHLFPNTYEEALEKGLYQALKSIK